MLLPSHGANPRHLYDRLSLDIPTEIYDLSENVNPAGPPAVIEASWNSYLELISQYPDPTGEPFLSKVADFHHVKKNQIVLGNGASEIFTVLARRYAGKRAIVVHPTFSEYEVTLRAAGAEVVDIMVDDIATWQLPVETLKREMVTASVLYVCTPNNPTGVLPSREVLEELIAHGREVNCEIVLDEAFIDWVDEKASSIPLISQNSHVLVVRSMTKLYAIPGIRLGYLVAHHEICDELREQLPHWHINGLAAVIGVACLASESYAKKAVQRAKEQRIKTTAILQGYGCTVTNSVTNYVAFRLPNPLESAAFFRFCLERGVVLRHSENFKGMNGEWFRIGMKEEGVMAVFEVVLADWFESKE